MPRPKRLTSSAADSHVSPSASRARGERRETRGGSGLTSRQLSLWSVPVSCSSKTSPGCGQPACVTCWPTLPHSGSMRNGICSSRPRRVLHIDEDACSFLPTPTATDYDNNMGGGAGRVGPKRLSLGVDGPPWAAPDANRVRGLQPSGSVGQQWRWARNGDGWTFESPVPGVAHGVPRRMDRHRLNGNAVVPQCAGIAWRTLMDRAAQS